MTDNPTLTLLAALVRVEAVLVDLGGELDRLTTELHGLDRLPLPADVTVRMIALRADTIARLDKMEAAALSLRHLIDPWEEGWAH